MRRLARARLLLAAAAGAVVVAALSCGDGDLPEAGFDSAPRAVTLAPVDYGDGPSARPSDASAGDRETGGGDDDDHDDAAAVVTDDAGFLLPGSRCEVDGGLPCSPGFGCCAPCCLAGRHPVCTRLDSTLGASKVCPLPDLLVDQVRLSGSPLVESVEAGVCELYEGCLGGDGIRRVLRFDVRVANVGAADLVLGSPDGSTSFTYSACHMHYHFDEFANYRLLDDTGAAVVTGRKQAFCARDSQRIAPNGPNHPVYDCNLQGISRGWEDNYDEILPCQWLDITDVAPGNYRLEVDVNPTRKITELRYDNNLVVVPVVIPP